MRKLKPIKAWAIVKRTKIIALSNDEEHFLHAYLVFSRKDAAQYNSLAGERIVRVEIREVGK